MKFNFFIFANLILSLTSLVLIFILLKYGSRKVHFLWALFNLAVFIWGFGCFLVGISNSPAEAMLRWRIANTGAMFIAIVFLHLIYEFCGRAKYKHQTIFLSYIFGTLFVIFDWLGLAGYNVRLIYNSIYYLNPKDLIYPFVLVVWSGIVSLGMYELVRYYRIAQGIKKNQVRYFLVGMLIGFSGGISHFYPIARMNIYPYGNIQIAVYLLVVTYAILRFNLMDIKVAITRTGIFIAVYSLVLGIPFWLAYGMQVKLRKIIGENWWIAPLVLLTFLAMLVPFIYLYVQRKAEDRLLREQRRYQQTLRRASAGMTRIRNLKKLLNLIVHVVTRTVHLKHSSIYLHAPKEEKFILQAFRDQRKAKPPYAVEANSTLIRALRHDKQPIVYEEVKQRAQDFNDVILLSMQKEMETLDAAVVVPSLVEEGLLGFIVLGEKISGRLYSQDDLSVFSVLANQSALAIENARYLESLSEAQKQLAQSERLSALGKFAASIVHEVKNPLTVIKTFTEYLPANYQDKAFVDKYSAIVGSEADKMNDLAHKLLDFSKPRALKLEQADIHKLLDGTLELLSNNLIKNRIKLVKDYTDLKLITQIDANQIKQAILNLLLNSIEAMPSGGVLAIKTEINRCNQNKICVIISDTGIGISDKDISHIFEPFYSTKEKGTGLGLAIVYSIIKEHRGDVRVESQTGKGTLFTIELPRVRP